MSQKFKSEVELQALNNATTDTDRFLVSDSGTVKYRTGSQILSDLGVSGIYVPYTGATGNVDLGTHTLSSYNLIVNHTSGSGVAASITKGGSGEALTINKTSGSGNAMSVTGGLTSLVDLTLSSIANATIDTDKFIVSDGGAIKYRTGAEVLSDIGGQAALTNPITGTGTLNFVSKFTSTGSTLGDSQIFDNGTNVLIGTTTDGGYKLDVNGGIRTILGYIRGANSSADINLDGIQGSRIRYGNQSVNLDSNKVYFVTNSTERMRITSAGNVLIGGTTDSGAKFQVFGQSNLNNVLIGNFDEVLQLDSKCAIFRTEGNPIGIRPSQAGSLVLQSRSSIDRDIVFVTGQTPTERMTIKGNGFVGIGTPTPNEPLHVAGNTIIEGKLNLQTVNNGIGNFLTINTPNGNIEQRTAAEVLSDIGAQAALTNPVTGTGTLNFVSKFTSTGSTLGDSQIFDNGTNVLIGNTSNFTSNKAQIQTTGSSRLLSLYNTTANGGAKIEFFDGTSNGAIGNLGANLVFYINSRDTERMRISSTGNVGIGTTNPTSRIHSVTSASGPVSYENRCAIFGYNTSTDTVYNNPIGIAGRVLTSGGIAVYGDATTGSGWGGYFLGKGYFSANVGIGTNNPTAIGTNITTLDIKGASGGGVRSGVAGGSESTFYTSAAGGYLGTISNIPLNFQTNNSVKATILANGNVGIGVTTPPASLSVQQITANSEYARLGTSSLQDRWLSFSTFGVGGTNSVGHLINSLYSTGVLAFGVNGEKMRITSTGNVGIGTTTPGAKLDVAGYVQSDLYEAGTTTPSNAGYLRLLSAPKTGWGPGDELGKIEFYSADTSGVGPRNLASIRAINNQGNGTTSTVAEGELAFYTSLYNTTESEAMRIDASGNVGIGTTSPTFTAGSGLQIVRSDYANVRVTGGISVGMDLLQSSDGTGYLRNRDNAQLRLGTNNVDVITLTNTGNVGIGTTSPAYKLHVAGGDGYFANNLISVGAIYGPQLSNGSSANNATLQVTTSGVRAYRNVADSNTAFAVTQTNASSTGAIQTWNNSAGEVARVAQNGNVGIGTSSPTTRFQVGELFKVTNDAVTTWGSTNSMGILSWDTNLAIIGGLANTAVQFRANNAEVMRLTTSGNVGIGTSSPDGTVPMTINANNNSYYSTLLLTNSNTGTEALSQLQLRTANQPLSPLVIHQFNSGGNAQITNVANSYLQLGTNNTVRLTITNGGAMGLGVIPTNTSGRFEASNDIVAYSSSDSRWKTNIKNIDSPLDKISQINGVEFDWIEDEPIHGNKGHDIGVIAQEVEQILPGIVQTRESGMKAVQYDKIIPLLIESIKEQQKQIEELKQIVNGFTK